MRALMAEEYGGPDVLRVRDLPVPQPGPSQVRVRVAAAGVNPADLYTRSGVAASMVPSPPPFVLGWDLAGTVEAMGEGVTGFEAGQSVIGLSDWFDAAVGVQAEQVVLDARQLAPAPRSVSPTEAATLPLIGLTALQALDQLALPPGTTLVVSGAAGGVGALAVQLATGRGLRVLAYAAAEDAELVRSLGAADLIPRAEDPVAAVRAVLPDGADAVLDAATIGAALLGAVRDGGVFLAVTDSTTPQAARGVRVEKVSVRSDGGQLAELARLVDRGRLTLSVADTFPLERAAEAHRRLEKGGVRGRLVLVP